MYVTCSNLQLHTTVLSTMKGLSKLVVTVWLQIFIIEWIQIPRTVFLTFTWVELIGTPTEFSLLYLPFLLLPVAAGEVSVKPYTVKWKVTVKWTSRILSFLENLKHPLQINTTPQNFCNIIKVDWQYYVSEGL